MKLNIPEIKIPEIKIPEVRIPKVKLPKGGIPKINIPKLRRNDTHDEPASEEAFEPLDDEDVSSDISDELEDEAAVSDIPDEPAEDMDAAGIETDAEAAAQPKPQEKVKSYGMVISEDQLRMVWAGEIGFSLLIVFASVLIAIAS